MTAGAQIADVARAHLRCGRDGARQRARAAIADVGLGDRLPRIYRAYPHELSGGQAQRIAIAQALVCRPAIIIADEPTSSLDAITRAEILRLVRDLCERFGIAFLLISHDPAVLGAADRVIAMSRGRLVASPLALPHVCAPRPSRAQAGLDAAPEQGEAPPVLSARGVTRTYETHRFLSRRPRVSALTDVDLCVRRGTTLGIVGESGAGKSTLARCLAGLEAVDAGEIRIGGRDIARLRGLDLRRHRRQVQLVFQDSASALNPRLSAEEIVAEPLVVQGIGTRDERRRRALALMSLVGLPAARGAARPSDFSGGERQRLAIARALAADPRVLVLDEAFSGIDRAHRSQIVDLLRHLQRTHDLTYVCISHDLALAAVFASELAVMQSGRIVEYGPAFAVLQAPRHPHTRALVSAAFPAGEARAELVG